MKRPQIFAAITWISLFAVSQTCCGETKSPIMTSDSQTLDVSVDGNLLAKDGWTLSPDFDPDVFIIRSRLPYKSKQVTFSSLADSVSFDVTAGNDYDFTVILNGETRCNVRIAALADPKFWTWTSMVPVGIVTISVFLMTTIFWQRIKPEHLLPLGVISPVLFWATTIVSGAMIADYDHVRNAISELGVLGTHTEVLTSSCFVAVSFTGALFLVGLYKACRQSRVSTTPVWLGLSMPVGMFWAAMFPMGNELHGLLGPLPLMLTLGSLSAFIFWKRREGLTLVSRLSLLSFFVMLLLFLIFVPSFNELYLGLVQRFWYVGWSIWSVSLAVCFSGLAPQTSTGVEDIAPSV